MSLCATFFKERKDPCNRCSTIHFLVFVFKISIKFIIQTISQLQIFHTSHFIELLISSQLLKFLIIIFRLLSQLYHRVFRSLWVVYNRWCVSINFFGIVHDHWNGTHLYSSDPHRSDISQSLRNTGYFKCCFHMIVNDGYKTSVILRRS